MVIVSVTLHIFGGSVFNWVAAISILPWGRIVELIAKVLESESKYLNLLKSASTFDAFPIETGYSMRNNVGQDSNLFIANVFDKTGCHIPE